MITKNRLKRIEKELKRQINGNQYVCLKVYGREIYSFGGSIYHDLNAFERQLPEDACLVIITSWNEDRIYNSL